MTPPTITCSGHAKRNLFLSPIRGPSEHTRPPFAYLKHMYVQTLQWEGMSTRDPRGGQDTGLSVFKWAGQFAPNPSLIEVFVFQRTTSFWQEIKTWIVPIVALIISFLSCYLIMQSSCRGWSRKSRKRSKLRLLAVLTFAAIVPPYIFAQTWLISEKSPDFSVSNCVLSASVSSFIFGPTLRDSATTAQVYGKFRGIANVHSL